MRWRDENEMSDEGANYCLGYSRGHHRCTEARTTPCLQSSPGYSVLSAIYIHAQIKLYHGLYRVQRNQS